MSGPYFGKKAFCLVTGASRGIGRATAVKLAQNLGAGSTLLVTARGKDPLEQLKAQLAKECPAVKVVVWSSDLTKADDMEYEQMMNEALGAQKASAFETAILVHNAAVVSVTEGSTEHKLENNKSTKLMDVSFHGNVSAMICLSTVFLKAMADVKDRLVVNITSLAGVEPFPGSAVFCATKAAREMYIRCLVLEDKTLRGFNYAPGAVDTKSVQDVAIERPEYGQLLDAARAGQGPFKLLKPEQTAERLFQIMEKNEFENGDHLDYAEDWKNESKALLAMIQGKTQ